ncbi:Recombinase [uncultured Eubacterium sp.]|nr:Recombinase [uncultured Eubacterium sp.]
MEDDEILKYSMQIAMKYVRMLKEMNVVVYFEVEKINTLKDGEFLTTILSSVAQQEVENTSAYVKKGLKMKMKRGEMVGSHRCFGYEVDKETRQLKIVEEEATAVRYIFNRYLEGAGGRVIANELNKKGIFTINNVEWSVPTVLGIIKNEKYKGDMLQGKTFTIDPISKRRIHNNGEEDKYYVIDQHEPIVSKEIFDKAQKLRKAKSTKKLANGTDQVVIK